ncbi:cation transporter [Chitinolyticbacter meiyuanensis]|uniref:cation transporter n=1 Tax=Chitinolyticbacter meiyuanensis TaxID=682798 RepID=UPI0011E5E8E9|nr:cation transporter [Chitinolyticbacter meiyuanensis]
MSAHCCNHQTALRPDSPDPRYRRALWLALWINAAMFVIEVGSGFKAGSVSLLADALDFLGDAANYGISLWVLPLGLAIRAKASLLKAGSMAVFGVAVLGSAIWHAAAGEVPSAPVMGAVGTLALAANLGVALLLYAHRNGDSNMRSVWLCTRNDALGNLAVLLAALGVFGTGTAWPDLAVAGIMALLALSAAFQVLRQARRELVSSRQGDPA